MTRQFILCLVTLSASAMTGCERAEVVQIETNSATVAPHRSDDDIAAETLYQMLEVAKEGDWEAYVVEYYGEQHKFRSPADREALVLRFKERWGEKLVQNLSRAAELPVQINGDKASFLDGDETVFVLHRGATGGWTFHL